MGSHIGGSEYDKELDEQLVLNILLDIQLHLWVLEACRKLNCDSKKKWT